MSASVMVYSVIPVHYFKRKKGLSGTVIGIAVGTVVKRYGIE